MKLFIIFKNLKGKIWNLCAVKYNITRDVQITINVLLLIVKGINVQQHTGKVREGMGAK